MENTFGMKVTVKHQEGTVQVFRNVTEVHYRYPPLGRQVAIESDIHGTGCTYPVEGGNIFRVIEMEIVPETELAEDF